MKLLDKRAAAYCAEVAKALPFRGRKRAAYLESLRQDADEYLRGHPWATGSDLAERFGEPSEIAAAFIAEMPEEEINAKIRYRKRVVTIVIAAAVLALLLVAVGIVLMYLRNAQDMSGYYVFT